MKILRRIAGGLRYAFTGKLPKKESKIIEDFFSVIRYRGTSNDLLSEEEVGRIYCLTTEFGYEINYCLQQDIELFSILEHIPSVTHFSGFLDIPGRNIGKAVCSSRHH